MMKWKNSLAFQFWIVFNAVVLIAVLTISGLYLYRESVNIEESLKNEALTATKTMNSAIGLYMLQEKYYEISPLTYALQTSPNIAYIIVKDQEGNAVNQKGDLSLSDDQLLVENVPITYFQETVGEVEIALKTDTIEAQKKGLLFDTILTALIFSIISFVLSFSVSKKLSSPIKRLINATKEFTEGNREIKVNENKSVVEIDQLATAFNQMSATINDHERILVNEIDKATRDLSEKVETLEILSTISNSILSENELQSVELMSIILIKIKSYIQSDRISYLNYKNHDKTEMIFLNEQHQISKLELSGLDESIKKAIEQKEIIVRNLLHDDKSLHWEKIIYQRGMKSLLIVPVIVNNKVIGTLNLASHDPEFFTQELIEKVEPFVNQIALGLDRISAYETLQYLAYHDYLTGLANYQKFISQLSEMVNENKAENKLAAIMILNLDRFKLVNDTFGRTTGDLLLKHMGQLLTSFIPQSGLVARFGGDEFSILLPNIKNAEEASMYARKILETLEKPIVLNDSEMTVSVSIGIALYPESATDAETLLINANRAMTRVKKKEKKNFAVYTQQIDGQTSGNLILENDIRKALDGNEFIVYYQPKVNTKTGIISGAEALIRWIHPKKGMISPGEFIPLAEESGLITQVGEFVLREAVNQIKYWKNVMNRSIPISVNLSTRQFFQSTLVNDIKKVIIESGIDPELLELEITESMSMDIENSHSILLELKKIGVRISVDDFGTGYSSLNYLRQLPIDRVKIDRSFINDMTIDESNEAIVATIINMSHNLKLSVIAEGVENEEQIHFLRKYNCDEIQGYYYSKPIPANEFEEKFLN